MLGGFRPLMEARLWSVLLFLQNKNAVFLHNGSLLWNVGRTGVVGHEKTYIRHQVKFSPPSVRFPAAPVTGRRALPGERTCKTITPVSSPLLLPFLSSSFPLSSCSSHDRLNKDSECPYLPAGLLPDPVLPLWTEQSLTGPRPCPESCDHVRALPRVQRWPWWTPAFTLSSEERNRTRGSKTASQSTSQTAQ